MPNKSVVVGSSVGLHARPAAIIAEAAEALDSTVTINGVDASSSLMIMTLGAKCGDTVEVAGEDQSAVDGIAALVEQDLDAD
jgi:phosphocarrier protein HPr